MKKKTLFLIFIFMFFVFNNNVFASTICEEYTTGSDIWYVPDTTDKRYQAMTFTLSSDCEVDSIKFKGSRQGTAHILYASIKNTDGSGHPTGSALCSGEYNVSPLPGFYNQTIFEIPLGVGCNLSSGPKYAIVLDANTGGFFWSTDILALTLDNAGGYADGNLENSTDGNSWSSRTEDLYFTIMGTITEPPAETFSSSFITNPNVYPLIFSFFILFFIGGMSLIRNL